MIVAAAVEAGFLKVKLIVPRVATVIPDTFTVTATASSAAGIAAWDTLMTASPPAKSASLRAESEMVTVFPPAETYETSTDS